MIERVDHIVLTTRDQDACIRFYTEVLGMKLERFSENRLALKFGTQKINLHEWGKEFTPRAHVAVPGSLDLGFIAANIASFLNPTFFFQEETDCRVRQSKII